MGRWQGKFATIGQLGTSHLLNEARSGMAVACLAPLRYATDTVKFQAKTRDPDMHQAKKGNNWHFGVKAHINVVPKSGLVRTVSGTPANVRDIRQTHTLVRGEESVVFGDAGYQYAHQHPENQNSTADWLIAMKRGKCKALGQDAMGTLLEQFEQLKVSIRTKIEHSFHAVKNLFKLRKTRQWRLAKNELQLFSLFGLANLMLARKRLVALDFRCAS